MWSRGIVIVLSAMLLISIAGALPYIPGPPDGSDVPDVFVLDAWTFPSSTNAREMIVFRAMYIDQYDQPITDAVCMLEITGVGTYTMNYDPDPIEIVAGTAVG